jgi:multidrug resistance efflux pump
MNPKLIKALLNSFGINIDPVEVEAAFSQAKAAVPAIVEKFDLILAKLTAIEERLTKIESRQE